MRRPVALGERNGQNVITEAQARAALRDPRPSGDVAAEYGCAASTIRHLRTGRTWKWIPRPSRMPDWPRGRWTGA